MSVRKPIAKTGITCLAFNKDKTLCALCPNSSDVLIYETKGKLDSAKWASEPKYRLTEVRFRVRVLPTTARFRSRTMRTLLTRTRSSLSPDSTPT